MIAIIDSGGANIASVTHALKRLGAEATLTSNAKEIMNAERIILPGVGAAKNAMDQLKNKDLTDLIKTLQQPVLGICLGMQLLFSHSEEGDTSLLDIMAGNVTHFDRNKNMTIPHMGWNNLSKTLDHPLVNGIKEDSYFYFVHSYYAPVSKNSIGICSYANEFTAIVAKDNFMGCQFHPERSGIEGQKILKNFLEIVL